MIFLKKKKQFKSCRYAECDKIVHIFFLIFSDPTFFKNTSVKSSPYLIPSIAFLYSTYLHNGLACMWLWPRGNDGLWNSQCTRYPLGLIWDLCQGKPSLSHRLYPQSHLHRLTASFFNCSSASENRSQLIRQ